MDRPLTFREITSAVRDLGIGVGNLLLVHSSYKSIRPVDGGPTSVAHALIDAVCPTGSVFMPTFNYGNDPFDPATAPSYDGIITEHFRKLPSAIRSDHPTHAIAGIGPDAAEILTAHSNAHPFGVGSPIHKLHARNAWVLLLGVDHRANSMAHLAEELLNMPYLDRTRAARVIQSEGSIREVTVRRPGCSESWGPVLDAPLRARNAIIDGRIGSARVMLMRSRDIVEVTMQLLRENPQALLCDIPACDACSAARRMLSKPSPTA